MSEVIFFGPWRLALPWVFQSPLKAASMAVSPVPGYKDMPRVLDLQTDSTDLEFTDRAGALAQAEYRLVLSLHGSLPMLVGQCMPIRQPPGLRWVLAEKLGYLVV